MLPETQPPSTRRSLPSILFVVYLLALIAVGVSYRFRWTNWSQGTNLHPDEYGLTGTLTQLQMPQNLSDYFNTRLSPISPYAKYDLNGEPAGNGPDNRMRWGQWPIILIRGLAEIAGQTGYDEMRLFGRRLSAVADTLALLLIFLIGRRLYDYKTGLLAAALSALAVMQIQQAHFMTVDNFSLVFTCLAMYAGVRIAQRPCVARPDSPARFAAYRPDAWALGWYLLFGLSFGMAMSSKINLLPLGGMLLIAAFSGIADLKLRRRQDLTAIFGFTALYLALAFAVALFTFRVTQPMSFRAASGDTTLLTLRPNPDWVESMKVAQGESSGVGGGPPGEQWAHRPAIIFPLVNMVLWGMGLPLGLMAWAGLIWAAWRLARTRQDWKIHILPLVWAAGYFLFMGTRWVKSIRYFLPIYPFLCLLAAWALLEFWRRRQQAGRLSRQVLPAVLILVVTGGTLAWAAAFTRAVYQSDHTRIQATRWIFANIPGTFHLTLRTPDGAAVLQPIPAPDFLQINSLTPFVQPFRPLQAASLDQIDIPHAVAAGDGRVRIAVSRDLEGQQVVAATEVQVAAGAIFPGPAASGRFQATPLDADATYYLHVAPLDGQTVSFSHNVVANESWDEGLPVPFDGWDPFGQLYRGATLEVRWPDDEHKLRMYLDTLAQVDYIILPSQRGIWTTCRIPKTYPMTMLYYRSLFDGQLGFDLVAQFHAPLRLGPLWVSDVGGSVAWNRQPELPVLNRNPLAAEEAFSVYDHPPVWIFKKRSDFNIRSVEQVLRTIDLSQVVVQSPRDATGDYCR